MAWNPQQNDPYNPPRDQFNPQGGQFDPYQQPPPSGGSLTWLWVLLGVGGGFIFLCCGGCCFLAMIGLEEEEKEIEAMLAGNAAIEQHIGDIESIDRDWTKSLEEEDDNIWVFRIVGDKGEGDLIIKEAGGFNLEEDLELEWAKLMLDSGEEIDVLP